jgi:hypothetical protein
MKKIIRGFPAWRSRLQRRKGGRISDTSQGEGWWQASDGKWHAPEAHPDLPWHKTADIPDNSAAAVEDEGVAPAPMFTWNQRQVSAVSSERSWQWKLRITMPCREI